MTAAMIRLEGDARSPGKDWAPNGDLEWYMGILPTLINCAEDL